MFGNSTFLLAITSPFKRKEKQLITRNDLIKRQHKQNADVIKKGSLNRSKSLSNPTKKANLVMRSNTSSICRNVHPIKIKDSEQMNTHDSNNKNISKIPNPPGDKLLDPIFLDIPIANTITRAEIFLDQK